MVLYAGEEFMIESTPLEVAVSIEYGLQQIVREVDRRSRVALLTNKSLDSEIVALAHSMEIFSDMEEKFNSISDADWSTLVRRNVHEDYIDFYDVSKRPYIPANAITCHDFNFEPGLSAESYIKLLTQLDRAQEQEWINAQDSQLKRGEEYEEINDDTFQNAERKQGDSGNQCTKSTSGDKTDESIKNQDDDYTPQSNDAHDKESSIQGDNDNSSEDITVDENTWGDDHGNTQGDRQGEGEGNPNGLNNDAEASGERVDSGEKIDNTRGENQKDSFTPSTDNPEQHEQDLEATEDHQTDTDVSDGSSTEYNPNNYTNEDRHQKDIEQDEGNTKYDPQQGGSGADGIPIDDDSQGREKPFEDPQEKSFDDIEELFDSSEDGTASQQGQDQYVPLSRRIDYQAREQNTVSASIPEKPDEAQGLTSSDVEEATNSLAEDVIEYDKSPIIPTMKVSTGSFESWAEVKTRKSRQSWKKVLPRMLTALSGKNAAAGLGDLSFSKRNPNQTEDMPLMMGFVTYPPNITILIDASPSMMMHHEKTISEFTALVGKFFSRFGEPITVAIADSGIQEAFSAVSINAHVKRAVKKTYSGSSATFGETIEQILKKGAKFRGRSFPKPDILVVLTDCEFVWPMMDNSKLPGKYADVIVVSTNEYDTISDILPPWVRNNKNFVYAI